MACTLYILENKTGRHYVGITKLNFEERLKRHNVGDVASTRTGRPWYVVHVEKYLDYSTARLRERQIKSWHGGNALQKLLSKAAGSSNGRTSPFGGEYLGSSPSPAALRRSKSGGVK